MLPLRAGVMAMKRYSAFPKDPVLLEPYHQNYLVSYTGDSLGEGSYPSAEIQSVYSTDPADWVTFR